MSSQIGIPGQLQELLHRNQNRRTFVFDQENDKFSRFGIAGIAANDMNVAGTFIEGLSRCQGDRFSTSYLHHDGPLEHVEKRVSIVSMNGGPRRQADIRL